MNSISRSVRFVLSLALVLALGGPSVAVALDRGPITNDVTVGGVSLTGMTEADARAAITANVAVPAMPALQVAADVRRYTFDPALAVKPDVEAMLAAAYETTTSPYVIQPSFVVSAGVLSAWTYTMSKQVNRKPTDARRTIVKRRLRVVPETTGRLVNRNAVIARLSAAIASRIESPTAPQPLLHVPVTVLKPRVSRATMGKTIVVSLREFKVFLYNGARAEKTYRCAIGMPGYSTPTGTFKVVARSARPSWRNPGSDWATNMPAYIAPGPSNPLGTRALYINAPGIRIHGTNKTRSIGTRASHGCVRLTNANIQDLYPRVPVGTPVYILK